MNRKVPKDVARLLRTFQVGDRVVAARPITYIGLSEIREAAVDEGAIGTVTEVVMVGLVRVHWDVQHGWDKYCELSIPTPIDSLDPIRPSRPRT